MVMLKSVEGVYRAGKIKLLDMPKNVNKAKVIVTFIPEQRIDLRERGIDKTHALHLRARLKAFAQDWKRPDMNAYDEL